MRRLAWLILSLPLGCADFQAALSECEQSGRCGDPGVDAPDRGDGGPTGGADAGQDAGENHDAGCVDLDLDGLGPGCALPDCDETDGQRPLQLPCREGAFVCQSCPGASDLNSGAAHSPLATIAAGISFARALKLPQVSVANESQYRASIYTGSFDMVSGVSVVGRYYVEDGGFLHPSAVKTVIHSDTADGVTFPPGIGRDTVLSGFQVRSVGGDAGTAITIRGASPTLDDVIAGFPLATADRSIGTPPDHR